MKKLLAAALAAFVTIAAVPSAAQGLGPGGPPEPVFQSNRLPIPTLSQRKAAAEQIIAKWRGEVSRSRVRDLASWSVAMRELVAVADAENIQRALAMTSIDDMHNALAGLQSTGEAKGLHELAVNGSAEPNLVGEPSADLVYTPLGRGRCNVAVTTLTANTPKLLKLDDIASYLAQGGSGSLANGNGADACQIPRGASAYLLNITVAGATATGQIRIYRNGDDSRTSGIYFYTAGATGVSQQVVVTSCRFCTYNIGLVATGGVRVIVNVIGYYNPPIFYFPDCYTAPGAVQTVGAGGTITVPLPVCSVGYVGTGVGCWGNSWKVNFAAFSTNGCSAYNPEAAPVSVRAYRHCCLLASPY